MNTLIGTNVIPANTLALLRSSRAKYPQARHAAYQNHELGHPQCGATVYLAVGPENTCKAAPNTLPDIGGRINWRFLHVGYADLEKGVIVPE